MFYVQQITRHDFCKEQYILRPDIPIQHHRFSKLVIKVNFTELRSQANALGPRVCKRVDSKVRPLDVLSTL